MFFRRQRPKVLSFQDRLNLLREAGFSVEQLDGHRVRAVKDGCAAEIEDVPGGLPRVGKAGVLVGREIGFLIDGGFQKFLRTPDGKKVPALASQLQSLHEFQEDLREAVGEESLYNESLGTTCDYHLYDRLEGRH